MGESSLTPAEAARLLGISEDEAGELARPDGRVLPDAVLGRLSGQLKEVRATNLRLQKEAKESTEERRRLTEEVLELRAAAEERLMLMERIEHLARIEQTLAESEAELERLRNRGPLARLLNR